VRLWSLHPKYLDGKGLVALWREGLLALKVLQGGTRGYTRHPQLMRFREQKYPVAAMQAYLGHIYAEAVERGYQFDRSKIDLDARAPKMRVTIGQLGYELHHLRKKLSIRDRAQFRKMSVVLKPDPHPIFVVTPGGIEPWERMKKS
jgi:hypothetical protein